jgi:hypothetical protein
MNFVLILKYVLALALKLADYVNTKKLMDAGASEVILKGIKDAQDQMARANNARAKYDELPVDKDPNNRANN